MPIIKSKKVKKSLAVKVSKPTKSLKSKPTKKPIKDPAAYFDCMKKCCQAKISPKRISQVAHECKTNALAINKKMSAQKKQDLQELAKKHTEFKHALEKYVRKH